MESKKPEYFFYLIFDERILETVAEKTNNYARNRITNIPHIKDPFEQMNNPSNNIRLLLAHIIIMSLVWKAAEH